MSKKAIEMRLVCCDDLNPIIIRDRKLIQKTPYLNRAAFAQNKKWTFNPVTFPNPIEIPFRRSIVEFVLHYSLIYRDPCLLEDQSLPAKLREYKEVYEKGLQDQKDLLECSRLLECSVLTECVGVVMAKKMQNLPFDQMEALFGVKYFTDYELKKDAADHLRIQEAKRRRVKLEEQQAVLSELRGGGHGDPIQDQIAQDLQQQIMLTAKEENPRYVPWRVAKGIPGAEKILKKDSDDETDKEVVRKLPRRKGAFETALEKYGSSRGPKEPEYDPEEWLPKPVVKSKPAPKPNKQAAPRGMSKQVKMTVVCKDGTIIVRDRKVIMKTPFLKKAASAENPKWASKHITFKKPVELPYSKSAVEFVLAYLPKYPDVRQFTRETDEAKLARYPEANEKGIVELREILDVSTDNSLFGFAHCVGYVLAEKLNLMDRKEIKEFLGDEYVKISVDRGEETIQTIREQLAVEEVVAKGVEEAPKPFEDILPPGAQKIGDLEEPYPQQVQETPVEQPKASRSFQDFCGMARRPAIQSYCDQEVPEVFLGMSYESEEYKNMVNTRLVSGENAKSSESEGEESEDNSPSLVEQKTELLVCLAETFSNIGRERFARVETSSRSLRTLSEDLEQEDYIVSPDGDDLKGCESSSRSSRSSADLEEQEDKEQEDFPRTVYPDDGLEGSETSSRSSEDQEHTVSPDGYLADDETSSLSSWSSEDEEHDTVSLDGYLAECEASSLSSEDLDDLTDSSRSSPISEKHPEWDYPTNVVPDSSPQSSRSSWNLEEVHPTTESLICQAETLFANHHEDCTRAQRRQVVDLIMRYSMIS